MLGSGYILNAPVLSLDTHLPTCPVLSISLLSPPAGGLHLFPLFSGACVGCPEGGHLQGGGDESLCHRLEGSLQDMCEQNHEVLLFMTDMVFKVFLTSGNIK